MSDDPIISEALAILRARYGEEPIDKVLKQELQRISGEMVEKAKAMRVPPEVQGVCPHSMVGKVDEGEYYCVDCKQRVYPDPEWFEKDFLLYGNRQPPDAAGGEHGE